ncbi:pyridoxal phosphate-dependent aminotransferase [Silvibacterium dinghuense]|uniref:Aminotransferase class I/II-fold pyridoxal phosphate-dependent enzyme n=1 Tax=Silvibacterium dinghuense TaxID=1560006 RepID=A0A4Q1SJT3_9BACT|nr:aminotransferase class I/II-fold pyridoxal phosphate-dependent enzyme [Silvibacterium dinghuense]RXS97916.1 aminotransferase class I/II-fold pyridoxal phosphate-dependent enzyme [Silvibacterium dinghuense]GGH02965.1 pyridoxal phosphate-dependent aminotransferase [Silvibacterium dinghuense]
MTSKKKSHHLARRLDEVGFSDIVQIRNKVLDLRAAGQAVHAFHGGEPFFETPEAVKYAMMKALVENRTRYAPSSGIEPLREAIARKLQAKNHIKTTAEHVIVTAGGAHALYAAFQTVLNPGDDVLLFSPYWTPIKDMITGSEARALFVPTTTARRNGITQTLEQFSTPNTRAIYYNTPQNPSGTVFTRAEAEEVAAFAKKHDLIVIADEAYEDLVYDGEHVSIASLPGMAERTITTYTLSKSYGMTGWRVGYAVAQEPFMTGLKKMVLYSVNGVSTPTQWAALEALRLPQSYLDCRLEQYRERRDLLVAGLNEVGLACETPAGAFYVFADAKKIHKDSRKAAATLLDKAHVATIPGVVFGAQGEGFVRFGYAMTMEAITAGLEALKAFGIKK